LVKRRRSHRQAKATFDSFDGARRSELTGSIVLQDCARNLRHGFRALCRSPGFTTIAILSLALGTGANTAVFRLLDAVRLKPLPVPVPEQIVEIEIDGGNEGFGLNRGWSSLTYPLWEQIRDGGQDAFSSAFAWSPTELEIGRGENARPVRAAFISGSAFSTIGIEPAAGRLLTVADDVPGCDGGVVISDAFWQREFAGAPGAVGSTVEINDRLLPIVGATGPEFFAIEVGRNFDIALPFCVLQSFGSQQLRARDQFWLGVMARLAPGWTAERAATYLHNASAGWFQAVAPDGYDAENMARWERFRLTATPSPNGVSQLRAEYEAALWLLLGITGLILLIAAANLANLMLARYVARRREIATRMALGASRWNVVLQLFAEGILLAVAGAAAGWLLAMSLCDGLVRFLNAQGNAIDLDLSADWRVVAFVFASATVACLFFGLVTALLATRKASVAAGTTTRNLSSGRQTVSFQRALIVGQIAVSLVLVVSSLLLVQSFRNLLTVDAGFNQSGLTFSYLNLARTGVAPDAMPELERRLLASIRGISGVESAASTTHLPLSGSGWSLQVRDPETGAPGFPQFTWVSPGYFETMQIRLLAGRDVTERDTRASPFVLIVNERFAREYVGEGDPIGRTVRSLAEPFYPEAAYQIVGVVSDTRYRDLRVAPPAIAYAPEQQNPNTRPRLIVVTRSSLPPATLTRSLVSATQSVNSGVVITETVELRSRVVDGLSRERMLAWLAGFFGLLAAVLVGTGLYGVVSYIVSLRRREFGIRIALGADAGSVVRMVLRQTAILAVVGCGIGLVVALAVTRVSTGMLFEISPADPVTLAAAVALLLGVAVGAAVSPSRSASHTDPMNSLRAE
jgi:putative ABC transport system permease protein